MNVSFGVDKSRLGKQNTFIKFCGLTRPEDVQVVNELNPEFVGFVFWGKSKRNGTRRQALELKKALSPEIKAVGVFVDEEPETIASLISDGIIDIAQLHGSEDEAYIGRLRELIGGKPIIKAFVVDTAATIRRIKASSADYLLLDSGKGTGQTFNWELIKEAGIEKPFFLAGGLDPENVAAAIEALHPFAVDVSSGIETESHKDPTKMKQFAENVRRT